MRLLAGTALPCSPREVVFRPGLDDDRCEARIYGKHRLCCELATKQLHHPSLYGSFCRSTSQIPI